MQIKIRLLENEMDSAVVTRDLNPSHFIKGISDIVVFCIAANSQLFQELHAYMCYFNQVRLGIGS